MHLGSFQDCGLCQSQLRRFDEQQLQALTGHGQRYERARRLLPFLAYWCDCVACRVRTGR